MAIQRTAYGPLGLTPAVFWALTPAELVLLAQGAKSRLEQRWDQAAWMVAYLLKPWGFDGTPAALLGRDLPDPTSEAATFDTVLGVPLSYDEVMAMQKAKGLSKS